MNALLNYGNRNATSPLTNEQLIKNYLIAVSASVGVGLSIRYLFKVMFKNVKAGPTQYFFNGFSSTIASCSAGYLNLYAMRQHELETGVEVMDEDGKVYGKSKVAASLAVSNTALSRVLLALPIMFPSMAMVLI